MSGYVMMSSSEEIETRPDLPQISDFDEIKVKSEKIDIDDEMFCEEGVFEPAITTVTNLDPLKFEDMTYEFHKFEDQKLVSQEFEAQEFEVKQPLKHKKKDVEYPRVEKKKSGPLKSNLNSYYRFHCLVCDTDFIRKGNLVNHMLKEHTKITYYPRSEKAKKTESKEIINSQEIRVMKGLKEKKEANKSKDANRPAPIVPRKIRCLDCGREFSNQSSLDRHECDDSAMVASQLSESEDESDSGLRARLDPRKFTCLDCGRDFLNQQGLDKHTCSFIRIIKGQVPANKNPYANNNRHIQTGPKKFNCLNCNKGFNHQSSLLRHQRTHTLSTLYQCHLCGIIKYRKDNLQSHIHAHLGHKGFQCETCHHKFTIKSNLNKHMILHHGYKNHHCKKCGQKFVKRVHFQKHVCIPSDGQ